MQFLKYIKKYWIILGDKLGIVNTHIILFLLYFLIITPLCLIMKVLQKKSFTQNSFWLDSNDDEINFKWQY